MGATVDDELRAQVRKAVEIDLVSIFADFRKIRVLLESAYATAAWSKMVPEAQEHYRGRVSAIVGEMEYLKLVD